ncbi:MAG: ABC transporter permease [Candidatus Hydrothermarchaeaceae archaeon]
MKILTLSLKELEDILSERVYLFAFLVQLIMVVSIIYAAFLYTSVTSPETRALVSVEKPRIGIIGEPGFLLNELEGLDVVYTSGDPVETLRNTDLVAVLVAQDLEKLSEGRDIELTLFLDNTNLLSGYADTVVTGAVNKISDRIRRERLSGELGNPDVILAPVKLDEIVIGKEVRRLPVESPEFVEIMYGILIPFILLLPTFLSANMMTDSIAGEKERRTYEFLVASPLSNVEIILGKLFPIILVAFIQAFSWVLLLEVKGIVIYNIPLLLLFLLLLDVLFVGFGIVISAFSNNLKESNLGVTLLLILVSLLFLAPIPRYSFSTFSIISKLSSNPAVSINDIALPFTLLFAACLITVYAGERLLEIKESLRL